MAFIDYLPGNTKGLQSVTKNFGTSSGGQGLGSLVDGSGNSAQQPSSSASSTSGVSFGSNSNALVLIGVAAGAIVLILVTVLILRE